MRRAFLVLIVAIAMASLVGPARAAGLAFSGDFAQGGLVVGHAPPGSKVEVDGKPVRVAADGGFLMGFGREAAPSVSLRIVEPSGAVLSRTIQVAHRDFPVQRINGLPEAQVTPDPKVIARIRAEAHLITEARKRDTATPFFEGGIAWPLEGRISGVFGSQRILNGKPRAPHSGMDIAAPKGTPVHAVAGGIVTVAYPDMFFTGRTVMIDHGHGLESVYAHMSEMDVKKGQKVTKGEVIGRVGQTGRATGPHLHIGFSLFETRLDPALVLGPQPKADEAKPNAASR